ncbi:MAG: hypothetical protein ACRENU_04055 [Gemmatimonadaceae bacterium]
MEPGIVQQKLAQLKRELQLEFRPKRPARSRTRPARRKPRAATTNGWVALALGLAKTLLVLVLPFYVYVRSSVYFYAHGAAPWLSVLAGALVTMAIVALYATWISRRFSGRKRAASMARWIALPIAAGWCGYAVLYLAKVNAKSPEVRSYYSSVHPVLRAALGTAILVDPSIVMTDGFRLPEDYTRMGLPINDRTLHYKQKTGWVHAVDLRTNGRGAVKNFAMQMYFSSMGFYTLRHVGNADHLHVHLKIRE